MRGDYLETHMMRIDHFMGNNEGTRREVVNEDNVVNKGMKKSFTSGSDEEWEN